MKKTTLKTYSNPRYTFQDSNQQEKEAVGMYLLITNKSVLNKAQNEADNLLQNFVANVKQQITTIYQKEKRSTNSQSSLIICCSIITKHLPNSTPINDLLPLLHINDQYQSHSLLNKPASIKLGHYPHPNFLSNLTFLPHHFPLHQYKKGKFKTKHHPSSPQLQTTLPIIN